MTEHLGMAPAASADSEAARLGLPPGPFGRVLWRSQQAVPADWASTWRSAGDGPFDAIVLDDVQDGASPQECETLQRQLVAGGLLAVLHPRRPRQVASRLRRYFEGGAPQGTARFHAVRARKGRVLAYRRGPALALGHFDELAEDYVAELPPHLVQHYLGRKLEALAKALEGRPATLGLDLGCGIGEYARAVAAGLGASVVAADASHAAVAVARRRGSAGVDFVAGDAQRLPFKDGSFDFAYTINMVHHLKRGEQGAALAEALRVLKPGAPLVVFEINVLNPLFRFYMRHVFPRTRRIDRGDEEFLTPRRLRAISPTPVESVRFSTFVPDFAPRALLPVLRPLEKGLERIAGPMGIHYVAVLRR